MTVIGCSQGLECVKRAVYTNPEGIEKKIESDEPMKCDDHETVCITASGSFVDGYARLKKRFA